MTALLGNVSLLFTGTCRQCKQCRQYKQRVQCILLVVAVCLTFSVYVHVSQISPLSSGSSNINLQLVHLKMYEHDFENHPNHNELAPPTSVSELSKNHVLQVINNASATPLLSISSSSVLAADDDEPATATTTTTTTKIIVAAYYRSGSTFVSDLLQLNNDTFYLFEPFYAIYANWYGTVAYHEVLYTGEGKKRTLVAKDEAHLISMVDDMLECRFEKLPPEFFVSIFLFRYPPTSSSSSLYLQCLQSVNVTLRSHQACFPPKNYFCTARSFLSDDLAQMCFVAKQQQGGSFINSQKGLRSPSLGLVQSRMKAYKGCMDNLWNKMSHCVDLLKQECLASKVRIIKTIRHSTDIIDKIINLIPNLKVIHLVRDPRAMLHSRQKWVRTTNKEIVATCSRLIGDQRSSQILRTTRADNYFLLRYEDLVTEPMRTALTVHQFVAIKPPDFLFEWVTNHTSAKADNSPDGTVRRDSAAHANQWRNNFAVKGLFARYASPECIDMMRQFKYDI